MRIIAIFLAAALLFSCKEEPFDPESAFTRIYDSYRGAIAFDPIDVTEVPTGYMILTSQTSASSSLYGVKLMLTDLEGNFIAENDLSSDYLVPVGDLINIDSTVYFFAMEPVSLQAVLLTANDSLQVTATPLPGQLTYPLAASRISNNELLLLSFNINAEQMLLSRINLAGQILQSNGYHIGPGSDIEEHILNHYTDPERGRLPFFCGEWSTGQYYFNGVFNYALSLVFTSMGDDPTGVVQGQGMNGGITAAQVVQGSVFTVFGFQYNDNFVLPRATLSTTGISSSVDLIDAPISEFRSRTNVDIESLTLPAGNFTVVAAETEARQIALYFYETASGELRGIHKVGYIQPYKLASIRADAEGNLLVLGTTFVGGRFERVFLSKIPASEVAGLVQ